MKFRGKDVTEEELENLAEILYKYAESLQAENNTLREDNESLRKLIIDPQQWKERIADSSWKYSGPFSVRYDQATILKPVWENLEKSESNIDALARIIQVGGVKIDVTNDKVIEIMTLGKLWPRYRLNWIGKQWKLALFLQVCHEEGIVTDTSVGYGRWGEWFFTFHGRKIKSANLRSALNEANDREKKKLREQYQNALSNPPPNRIQESVSIWKNSSDIKI